MKVQRKTIHSTQQRTTKKLQQGYTHRKKGKLKQHIKIEQPPNQKIYAPLVMLESPQNCFPIATNTEISHQEKKRDPISFDLRKIETFIGTWLTTPI